MSFDFFVSRKVFKAVQTLDINELFQCSTKDLRPVLPFLVRASMIPTKCDITVECSSRRKEILLLISGTELATSIVELLILDFTTLEQDIKSEQHMRLKVVRTQGDSKLFMAPRDNLGSSVLQFERSSTSRKLQFVLNELLFISSLHHHYGFQDASTYAKQLDLFDYDIYLPEICDVIIISLMELPMLLTIQDAIEALLCVYNGAAVICWIVANLPETFNEVCTFLMTTVKQYKDSKNNDEYVQVCMNTLCLLCHMNPSQTLTVSNKCVEMLIMPALVVKLNLVHFANQRGDGTDHILAFVSGLLLGNSKKVRNWFAMFLHKSSQKQNHPYSLLFQALRTKLLDILKNVSFQHFSDKTLINLSSIRASSLIRFYCAFYGLANIKFLDEEVFHLVQLLTSHPPASSASVRFLSLGLCMLVVCPSLLSNKDNEKKCVQWLKWLTHENCYFINKTSFGQTLILLAIHFHNNQVTAISDLVCSTLGMKLPIHQNNIIRLKQIFVQEIFTESLITSHAVKIPITTNLNAGIPGFLPVHCMYQLLKSRAFMKHKVSIKKWILKQLCSSVVPLHPVLPVLIDVYANFVLAHDSKLPQNNESTRQYIEIKDIRKVFKNTFESEMALTSKRIPCVNIPPLLTSQLLLLYYLLCYEDVRLKHFASLQHLQVYSTEFLSELPIKYLIYQAQYCKQNYTCLFIPLLKLLVSLYPQLSLIEDWFTDITDKSVLMKTTEEPNIVLEESSIVNRFNAVKICANQVESVLYKMLSASPALLWSHADIILQQVTKVIDSQVPRQMQELFKLVWFRLNAMRPRYVQAKTWKYLAYRNNNDILSLAERCILDHTSSTDPLVPLLNCDSRVFRCPPILEILLRVLQSSLVASRNKLFQHKERIYPNHEIPNKEVDCLYDTIVATQESIAVQTLLEKCLETAEDKMNPGQLWTLQEVRSIICSYIHQVFIADPSLAKLVHFQGYASALLSTVTVPGIPSVHICLDFIPELLSLPELDKQVFAVDLLSHLSLQYALPKTMSIAWLAVNTLSTLINVLSADVRITLFIATLPALVRICEAFPILIEDALRLLVQLGSICLSFSCTTPDGNNRPAKLTNFCKFKFDPKSSVASQNDFLVGEIQRTFEKILKHAMLKTKVY